MPYYAVHRGRIPGVYETWDETQQQTDGFPKARYKRFDSYTDALHFFRTGRDPHAGDSDSITIKASGKESRFVLTPDLERVLRDAGYLPLP